MKKLTAFFAVLLCLSFINVSAQYKIRYSVLRQTSLRILVNGSEIVNEKGTDIFYVKNGEITVSQGAFVEVYASSDSGNTSANVEAIIAEDDPYMIGNAASSDYNYLNEDHTLLYEYFTMPPVDMYIEMKS